MLGKYISGEDAFWDYAKGDTCFAIWLKKVDDICMRFLDQDLLSISEIDCIDGLDLRDAFDLGTTPGEYFSGLMAHMKIENGDDLIEEHVAKMAKWGTLPYEPR
jgi:hypothetical protein